MRRILFLEEWIRPWWLAMVTYLLILSATIVLWPIVLPNHGRIWLLALSTACHFVLGMWCGRGAAMAHVLHQREKQNRENDYYEGL